MDGYMTFLPNEIFFNVPSTIEQQYNDVMLNRSSRGNDTHLFLKDIVEWVSQGIDESSACHFTIVNILQHLHQTSRETTLNALKKNLHDFYQSITNNPVNHLLKSKICYELNDRIKECTPALCNALAEAIMQLRVPKSFDECLYAFRVLVAQRFVANLIKVRIRGMYSEQQYLVSEPHTKNKIYQCCDKIFATRLYNPHDIYQGLLPTDFINQELMHGKYYEFNFFFVLEGIIEQFKDLFASVNRDKNYGYLGQGLDDVENTLMSIFSDNQPFVRDYWQSLTTLKKLSDELSWLAENLQQEKILCLGDSLSLKQIVSEKKQQLIQLNPLLWSEKLSQLNAANDEEVLDYFLQLMWLESQSVKSFRVTEPFEIAGQCLIGFSKIITLHLKYKQKKDKYDKCFTDYEKAKEVFRTYLFICEQPSDEHDYLEVVYRDINWASITAMLVKELLARKYFDVTPIQESLLINYFSNQNMDAEIRLNVCVEIIQYLPFMDYQSFFLKISLEQFYYSFCHWIYWRGLVCKLLDKPFLIIQLADFFINQKASIIQFQSMMELLLDAFPTSEKRQFLKRLGHLVNDSKDLLILRPFIDDDLAFSIIISLVKTEHDFLYFKDFLNEKNAGDLLLYSINAEVFPMDFTWLAKNIALFINQPIVDVALYFTKLASLVNTKEDMEVVLNEDMLINNGFFLKTLLKQANHLKLDKLIDRVHDLGLKEELKVLLKFNQASDFYTFKLIFARHLRDYVKFYQQGFLTELAKSYMLELNETLIDFRKIIKKNQFNTLQFFIDKRSILSKSQAFELLLDCYHPKGVINLACSAVLLKYVGFKEEHTRVFHRIYERFCFSSDYQFFDMRYALYYLANGHNTRFYDLFSSNENTTKKIKEFLIDCHFDDVLIQLINKTLELKKTLNQPRCFFLDTINAQKSVIAIDNLITGLYQQKVLLFETSNMEAFKNNCQQLIGVALPVLNCQRHKFSSLIEPIMKIIRAILKAFGVEKTATKTSDLVMRFSNQMMG